MISSLIIGAAFVAMAAIFCAVMDTLSFHFDTSVFRNRNTAFWNPLHPENDNVKMIAGYPLDAWHIAKSAMIASFLLLVTINPQWWFFFVYGVVFILVFNLFFNKILWKYKAKR